MAVDVIITEKPLIARQIAKVGLFGAPTSFKLIDGIYYENDSVIIIPCQGHLFMRPLPYEINEAYGFAYKKVDGYDYASPNLLNEAIPYLKKSALKLAKAFKEIFSRKDIKSINYSGDADAEGEKIVRDVVKYFGKNIPSTVQHYRIWNTGSWDVKSVIEKAWKDRLPISTPKYEYLSESVDCRGDADYYCGMVFCKVYTDKTETKFRYGRVWIALLSLVCNRELAIVKFKPRGYSNIKAPYGNIIFSAFKEEEKLDDFGKKIKVHTKQFFDDELPSAEQVISDVKNAQYKGKVIKNESYETSSRKPLLYNLNTFNSDFMTLYNKDAVYSEACAEFLRFKNYIDYVRTDGHYFGTDEKEKVEEIRTHCMTYFKQQIDDIKAVDKGFNILPVDTSMPLFNDKEKVKQNHAPLHILCPLTKSDIEFLSQEHSAIEDKSLKLKHLLETYNLIATRCAIQFMPDDIKIKENIVIEIAGHQFETESDRTIYKGWKEFDKNATVSNGKEIKFSLKEGDEITVDSISSEKYETKPPKRYTEDSLRKACVNVKSALIEEINNIENPDERKKRMDRFEQTAKLFDSAKGIGTQGTLKDIFQTAIKDGVFEMKKRELVPTDTGWFVFNTVHPYLKSLELTAIFESYLIDIRSGLKTKDQFKKEFLDGIIAKLARSEAERNIAVSIQAPSPKLVKYAENMAKKLGISIPAGIESDRKQLSQFIDEHKEEYEKTFNSLPDYVINTIKGNLNHSSVTNEIKEIIQKSVINKDEYMKCVAVYKELPKVYDKFLDGVIKRVLNNKQHVNEEIVAIVEKNQPTADEYKKVMEAVSKIPYSLSEKQRAMVEKNLSKLPKKAQDLFNSKTEYNADEWKIIKAGVDKLFEK